MLSYEDMCLDYMKCYQDKSRIFFIEKYLSTFNADVRKSTPFKLFPRQKVFLQTVAEKPNTIAIKHRQCGITTISSAWVTGQFVFCDPGSKETVLAVANKMDLAVQIIDKIRDFLLQIPRWFWGDDYYSPDPKSPKNKKSIFVRDSKQELELFNGCRAVARSSGENASRGISAVSILIMDEAAFIAEGMSVYASAAAAMASVRDAKIIMVSTPNGKDPLYYNTYRKAISGENNFTPVEFKWYQDLRYNRFLKWYKKDEKSGEIRWDEDPVIDASGNIIYDEERWTRLTQNGWKPTSPWYDEMCKSFNNDSMKIAQELDVSFLGSSNNVVQPEIIEMQNTLNVREPLTDFRDPFVEETWFWKKPIDGHRYLLSCLPEGEQVVTRRGLVNVEDVREDDELVTKEGEFTRIRTRMVRDVEDEDVYSIKVSNYCGRFRFTGNHPIYASAENIRDRCYKRNNPDYKFNERYLSHKFQFINAEKIKVGDWVEIPNIYYGKVISDEELREIGKEYGLEECITKPDFWWYCGMWLAEGCACKASNGNGIRIYTSHNINEIEYITKCQLIAESMFGKHATIYNNEKVHVTNVSFVHIGMANFLHRYLGKYAGGKYISEFIKILPDHLKKEFLRAYFSGDGSLYENKRDGLMMSSASISLDVTRGIQDMLFSIGIMSCVSISIKEGKQIIFKNRLCNLHTAYELKIQHVDTLNFLNYLYGGNRKAPTKRKMTAYITKDKKFIRFQVKEVTVEKYTGKVYNFETENESHTYITSRIGTHNCDASTGDAHDKTAIQVFDLDGIDENGFPVLDQVMEYNGKKFGDTIGEMIFQYARMYNEAFVVVEAIGGYGDSVLLTLMNLGYKNLYYEDKDLSRYTSRVVQTKFTGSTDDKLPGFRTNSVRFQMLSNFAIMLKNNEFKVRSKRLIGELETWVFKGDSGRMDHLDGASDDLITCTAMGLFVLKYSINRIEATKQKDGAILKAYMTSSSASLQTPRYTSTISAHPMEGKSYCPFYKRQTTYTPQGIDGSYLWLLTKTQ